MMSAATNTVQIKEPDIRIRISDKKALYGLSVLSILFVFLQNNQILNLAAIALFLAILAQKDMSTAICSYFYLTTWERFTTMPVLSAISIIDMILGFVVVIQLIHKRIRIRLDDSVLLCIACIYSVIALLLHRNMSGIKMIFDVFIVIYIRYINQDKEDNADFWKRAFLFIYISTVLSIMWGFVSYMQGNVATIHLDGNIHSRLRSTVGTDRSCMLYCAAAIYPFFYMKKKWLKICSLGLLATMTLLTISITAVLCASVFCLILLIDSYRKSKLNKGILVILIALILGTFYYVYNYGSGITAIDNMINRTKKVSMKVSDGDFSNATSGRTEIFDDYWYIYSNRFSFFNKLFGSGVVNYKYYYDLPDYVHNTYMDMLLYMGLIPLIFVFYRFYNGIKYYKNSNYQLQILLLKTSYALTALSVSMFTATYWWVFFII